MKEFFITINFCFFIILSLIGAYLMITDNDEWAMKFAIFYFAYLLINITINKLGSK